MDKRLLEHSKNGNIENVKFLLPQCRPTKKFMKAFILACANGHLDIVKYFIEERPDLPSLEEHAINSACANGYIRVAKYLIDHGAKKLVDSYLTRRIFDIGNVELIKYLFSLKTYTCHHVYSLVYCAYHSGNINLVEFIIEQNFDLYSMKDGIFNLACGAGKLNIVKKMDENNFIEKELNVFSKYDYGFFRACENGHLHIIKYIFEKYKPDVLRESWIESAIIHNQIHIAEYLLEYGTNIVIREHALNRCYINGHLEFLQYLKSLGFDIKVDEFIFYRVVLTGNIPMQKFILSELSVSQQQIDSALKAVTSNTNYINTVKFILSLENVSFDPYWGLKNSYENGYISMHMFISNFCSKEQVKSLKDVEQFTDRCDKFTGFNLLLYQFYFSDSWIVNEIDIKDDHLWDANIGLIVAMFYDYFNYFWDMPHMFLETRYE